MIIKRLQINKLYGVYNYDVHFNDDITFIYGENGCGKTTILNILSYIVTGKVYKLDKYKFKDITFTCLDDNNYKKAINIEKECGMLIININGENEEILNLSYFEDINRNNEDDLDSDYVNKFSVLKFLRENFSYVYLPLSRDYKDTSNTIGENYTRRLGRRYVNIEENNYLKYSIAYVEEIIKGICIDISIKENKINQKFKNDIIITTLKVATEYAFDNINKSTQYAYNIDKIERNHKKYVQILNSMDLWNNDIKQCVDNFFKVYKKALQHNGDNEYEKNFNIGIMNNEFKRIQAIAEQAQKMENEKLLANEPINKFLGIINDFFGYGSNQKRVCINAGRLVVETKNPIMRLRLSNLSSGEKQIIIIFAFFVFRLSDMKDGVYIIDEPEASLHLNWQNKFVKSLRMANDKIQLIFATHSPEIIGNYLDKLVELKREIDISAVDKIEEEDYDE